MIIPGRGVDRACGSQVRGGVRGDRVARGVLLVFVEHVGRHQVPNLLVLAHGILEADATRTRRLGEWLSLKS